MFKFNFRKKKEAVSLDKIPNHIGIIMDGNGRWAKKRMQPRVMGHKAGMDALQDVTIASSELGVKVLTVYAFSTENWSRPEDEVKFIMNLPVESSINMSLNWTLIMSKFKLLVRQIVCQKQLLMR